MAHLFSASFAAATEVNDEPSSVAAARDDPSSWDEYVGDGYALRVPPGFENTVEPDEYPAGERPLYGYTPKAKVFNARFASPDGEEFVSVIIRKASQVQATFFEAKSITDLGKLDDISRRFLPVGASLTSSSSATSTDSGSPERVYYMYEYIAGITHGFLSATVRKGQVFIAAATLPRAKWDDDGSMMKTSVTSFSLL